MEKSKSSQVKSSPWCEMEKVQKSYGVDETSPQCENAHYEFQSWKDEFLVWDKDQYDGLDQIAIPIDKLWNPDVTLWNS